MCIKNDSKLKVAPYRFYHACADVVSCSNLHELTSNRKVFQTFYDVNTGNKSKVYSEFSFAHVEILRLPSTTYFF